MASTVLGVAIARAAGETVKQNAQPEEVVEMGVRYIGWSPRLRLCRATQSARASASATVPIASTSTASYSPKIKVDVDRVEAGALHRRGFGLLADLHRLSRCRKDVHTQRVQRDWRAHARC